MFQILCKANAVIVLYMHIFSFVLMPYGSRLDWSSVSSWNNTKSELNPISSGTTTNLWLACTAISVDEFASSSIINNLKLLIAFLVAMTLNTSKVWCYWHGWQNRLEWQFIRKRPSDLLKSCFAHLSFSTSCEQMLGCQ